MENKTVQDTVFLNMTYCVHVAFPMHSYILMEKYSYPNMQLPRQNHDVSHTAAPQPSGTLSIGLSTENNMCVSWDELFHPKSRYSSPNSQYGNRFFTDTIRLGWGPQNRPSSKINCVFLGRGERHTDRTTRRNTRRGGIHKAEAEVFKENPFYLDPRFPAWGSGRNATAEATRSVTLFFVMAAPHQPAFAFIWRQKLTPNVSASSDDAK